MRTNRGSTVYYWRDLYVLIVLQSVSLALKQFHRLLNDPNTRLLICHLFSFVNCLILLKSTVILMRVLLSCLYRINHQSINIIPLSKMFLPLRTFHFMVSFKKGLEALHVCSQLWNLFFFLSQQREGHWQKSGKVPSLFSHVWVSYTHIQPLSSKLQG